VGKADCAAAAAPSKEGGLHHTPAMLHFVSYSIIILPQK
jgi:hypothetical protein